MTTLLQLLDERKLLLKRIDTINGKDADTHDRLLKRLRQLDDSIAAIQLANAIAKNKKMPF